MARLKLLAASNGKDLPIIDATAPMTLHVGAEELANAKTKQPTSCALAQACLRKKGVKEVRVHLSRAYIRTNELNWQRFLVSDHLRREIVVFDRGGRFAPGDYVLQKINPAKRLGADKRKRTGPKPPGKRKRRQYSPTQDVRLGPA